MNQERHDPLKPLHNIMQLVDKKCQELPHDINHWEGLLGKHQEESQTYKNIQQSSIKPRQRYLKALESLRENLTELAAIVDGKSVDRFGEYSIDMPVETLMRRYVTLSETLQKVAEDNQTFITFFNSVIQQIESIIDDLNQPLLRCSIGQISFKDACHQVRVLQPTLETSLEQHIINNKIRLDEISDILLQRIEMDLSVRKSIQDRAAMHSTLQTYLSHIESNKDFDQLMPTIQYKIRQKITAPLDSILSEQQKEVDVAQYELQQFLEPIQGETTIKVPGSASNVHQLIQQAINQHQEMARLKLNVVGAFKHLVGQLDDLFQFKPITPVQSASVLGAAWMQHPLTTVEELRDLKGELDIVKKTESYNRLIKLFCDDQVDKSFKFVDDKISEIEEQLEVNTVVVSEDSSESADFTSVIHADEVMIKKQLIDPVRSRRKIVERAEYLNSIKGYISRLCESVKGHLYYVYYRHSLNPIEINLKARVNEMMNQVVEDFVSRTDIDEKIDRDVLMSSVKNVFNEICDDETEKNMDIASKKQGVKKLMQQLRETKKSARRDVKRKILSEKVAIEQLIIDTNIPRLRHYISTMAKPEYSIIHIEARDQLPDLQKTLRKMIQHSVALKESVTIF